MGIRQGIHKARILHALLKKDKYEIPTFLTTLSGLGFTDDHYEIAKDWQVRLRQDEELGNEFVAIYTGESAEQRQKQYIVRGPYNESTTKADLEQIAEWIYPTSGKTKGRRQAFLSDLADYYYGNLQASQMIIAEGLYEGIRSGPYTDLYLVIHKIQEDTKELGERRFVTKLKDTVNASFHDIQTGTLTKRDYLESLGFRLYPLE